MAVRTASSAAHASLRTRAPILCADDDWRSIRAGLVQGEQAESTFAYESPLIEVGACLLDTDMLRRTEMFGYPTVRPTEQAFFHKSVMLIMEHDPERGTSAVILNRPSAMYMDGWRLWYGGPCGAGGLFGVDYVVTDDGTITKLSADRETPDTREFHCLHSLGAGGRSWRGVTEGEEAEAASQLVLPGLWTTSLEGARQLVEGGGADKRDLCLAVGSARWRPGQLEEEIARGSWAAVTTDSRSLVDVTWPADVVDPPRDGMASLHALDGLAAWEALAVAVGCVAGGDALKRGTQGDGQLAEWVRTRMLPPRPSL